MDPILLRTSIANSGLFLTHRVVVVFNLQQSAGFSSDISPQSLSPSQNQLSGMHRRLAEIPQSPYPLGHSSPAVDNSIAVSAVSICSYNSSPVRLPNTV